MTIEIVDFPIKNGDFPLQTVSSPEGSRKNYQKLTYVLNGKRNSETHGLDPQPRLAQRSAKHALTSSPPDVAAKRLKTSCR